MGVFEGRGQLERGMKDLLASAPSAVRTCLERQLGRIAARNSCTGPWQPALDLQLNWRPAWFGSERRLALSIVTVNLLDGVDAWLHGAEHLQGWGYSTTPDPVLLYVQGFEQAAQRFHYAVNGRFGAAATTDKGILVPFQIAFQGRLTIGPHRAHTPRTERSPFPGVRSIMREPVRERRDAATPPDTLPAAAGPDSMTSTLPPPPPLGRANLVGWILGLRIWLSLSPDQIAALQPIADSVDAQGHLGVDSLGARAPENARRALERARGVLRPEQWGQLTAAFPALDTGEPFSKPQH
jgi:hypothetical protein